MSSTLFSFPFFSNFWDLEVPYCVAFANFCTLMSTALITFLAGNSNIFAVVEKRVARKNQFGWYFYNSVVNDFSLQHSIMRKLGDAHHHHVKPPPPSPLVGARARLRTCLICSSSPNQLLHLSRKCVSFSLVHKCYLWE